jgi:hypothetical protein
MSTTATLCGTGWITWPEVRTVLAGWEATWSDLDGAHLGELPEEIPAGTHLWAWQADVWARVRIDDDQAVIGLLHPAGQCPRGDACPGAPVTTTPEITAAGWPDQHIRLPVALRSSQWLIRHVREGVSTAFHRQA